MTLNYNRDLIIFQLTVKATDNGVPPCETPAIITITVPRNQQNTTLVNLPAVVNITDDTNGRFFTVRGRDTDLRGKITPPSIKTNFRGKITTPSIKNSSVITFPLYRRYCKLFTYIVPYQIEESVIITPSKET